MTDALASFVVAVLAAIMAILTVHFRSIKRSFQALNEARARVEVESLLRCEIQEVEASIAQKNREIERIKRELNKMQVHIDCEEFNRESEARYQEGRQAFLTKFAEGE